MPKKYLPEFRYFKIAINEIPKSELVKIRNAVATIFYFENCTPEDIINNRKELVGLLKSVFLREGREIVQTIIDWIYASNKISEPAGKISSIESITEVESMLETAVIRHENKMIEKGMKMGMEKSTLEAAQKMLANGISVSMVKKVTGLSTSKITVLKKNVVIGGRWEISVRHGKNPSRSRVPNFINPKIS